MKQQQINEYCERVGLKALPEPNLKGLFELHRAQFFTIPFENLDIQLGREISLEPNELFEKLVLKKRGGYCFELNSLMKMVLESSGYHVKPLLARVHLSDPPSGLTHLINLVTMDNEPWIMDVGFGAGGPRQPLKLRAGETESTAGSSYRLGRQAPWGWLFRTKDTGEWKDSYSFGLHHVTRQDLEVGNFYTSHSPNSHFTTSRVVSLPTTRGRMSLRNFELTKIDGQTVEKSIVAEGQPYLDVLESQFNLKIEVGSDGFRPLDRLPQSETDEL